MSCYNQKFKLMQELWLQALLLIKVRALIFMPSSENYQANHHINLVQKVW